LGWDDVWFELFRDILKGTIAPVLDVVEKILGKAPRTFETYIQKNKELWL